MLRLGVAVLAGLALAGPPTAASQTADARILEEWRRELAQIRADLMASRWEVASAGADRLWNRFDAEVVGGDGAAMLMGMVMTYRAVAEAGLGSEEAAIWHWQVAQQLFPDLQGFDMGRFGGVTSVLRDRPPRLPDEGVPGSIDEHALQPPRKLHAPSPEFPTARRYRGALVDVVVQVIIDTAGVPRDPVILESKGEPTLVAAALEALRLWRFEPARRDGAPVPILYRLTVRFQVPETLPG